MPRSLAPRWHAVRPSLCFTSLFIKPLVNTLVKALSLSPSLPLLPILLPFLLHFLFVTSLPSPPLFPASSSMPFLLSLPPSRYRSVGPSSLPQSSLSLLLTFFLLSLPPLISYLTALFLSFSYKPSFPLSLPPSLPPVYVRPLIKKAVYQYL